MFNFIRTPLIVTLIVALSTYLGLRYLTNYGNGEMDLPVVEGQGEYVLNDEFSLWQSAFNSGISYYEYEPIRVRQNGAEYYHRNNEAMAASGSRFGEIVLNEDDGHLLYLPRKTKYQKEDKLSLFIKTEPQNKNWQIALYPTARKVAYITKDSPNISISEKDSWQKVTIPLSSLNYETLPKTTIEENTQDAAYLLSLYKPKDKYLYGIDFSLKDGQKGDKIFIDRISLLKTEKTQENIINGYIINDKHEESFTATAITDKGSVSKQISKDGHFTIQLPEKAQMAEIYIEDDKRAYSPRGGRFYENASYMPLAIFVIKDEHIDNPPIDGSISDAPIRYEENFGVRYEPNQNFLRQIAKDNNVLTAAELATNQYGFIDTARRSENPDNKYRVMILGDYQQMGSQINQANMFQNEAEGLLNIIAERPVEIINAGSAYSTFTSSWPIIRDYAELIKPDLVLITMADPGALNLAIEEYMMQRYDAAKDHRVSYQFELDENGKLIHKPNDPNWQNHSEKMSKEDSLRIRSQYLSSSYTYKKEEDTPDWVKDSINLNTQALKEFAKLAKKRGQRIGILYLSNYGRTRTSSYTIKDIDFDENTVLPLMRKMAKEAGLEFFDISENMHLSLNENDFDFIMYKNNDHLTAYGHFKYGQALAIAINNIISGEKSEPK